MSGASGIDFQWVRADVEFAGRSMPNVAARYKGNNTFMMARNSEKRSFKLDLNRNVKGQKLAGQTTLNLHNNIADASWMNESISYALFREAGVPSPRTCYARVYVTVDGQFERKYLGLYSIVENIDAHFASGRFGRKDGAIFKPVGRELFTDLGADWSKYNQTYDPKTTLTEVQKQRVIDFARLVSSASDEDFAKRVPEFLDLDEFARFMAVTVWLSNMDSILGMGQNFYVYLSAADNRFRFLPWDLDHSFGQFPMMGGQGETLSISKPWQGPNKFLERVFAVPEFRKLYLARLSEFQDSFFQPARISSRVDEIAAAIRPAVAAESDERLKAFDSAVAGKTPQSTGVRRGPGAMKPIKAFVQPRAESVRKQLAGGVEPRS